MLLDALCDFYIKSKILINNFGNKSMKVTLLSWLYAIKSWFGVIPSWFLPQKIFDFSQSLVIRVLARKFHTRPRHISTCIVPGLVCISTLKTEFIAKQISKMIKNLQAATIFSYEITPWGNLKLLINCPITPEFEPKIYWCWKIACRTLNALSLGLRKDFVAACMHPVCVCQSVYQYVC